MCGTGVLLDDVDDVDDVSSGVTGECSDGMREEIESFLIRLMLAEFSEVENQSPAVWQQCRAYVVTERELVVKSTSIENGRCHPHGRRSTR